MNDCCSGGKAPTDLLQARQSKTLKAVFGINAAMFLVEIVAGILAASTALVADSLDMLGDALVYGFSLYVVARSDAWKAGAALAKGVVMGVFGLFVLGQAAYKLLHPEIPVFEAIALVGLLALAANGVCLHLLWQHRGEDINMRSVWLCSRNDIIANGSVLVAAAGVWLTASQWPDLLIGGAIAVLFLRSSVQVIRDALRVQAAHKTLEADTPQCRSSR